MYPLQILKICLKKKVNLQPALGPFPHNDRKFRFDSKGLEDLAIQGHVKDQVAGDVDRCHQAALPVDGLVCVTSG